jgi:lysylphosphatidylglycerol synthetase-like protein (DUF2156 family)
MADGRRDTLIRSILAALLAAFGAYASSVALDLIAGIIVHVDPAPEPVIIVLWALMSVAGVALAVGLRPDGRAVWISSAALAVFAVVNALRGNHPRNWLVAVALVVQTALVWSAARRAGRVRTPSGA